MTSRRPRTTAAMQEYGSQASPDHPRGTRAGLVLLYASSFTAFAPAYLLSEHDLVIGREPGSGLAIPEGAASRQHAHIRYKSAAGVGSSWILADLGSRNGTLVDGRFVREIVLEDLHEIRIGDAIFKFVSAGAESYGRYRVDGEILVDAEGEPTSLTGIYGGYQIRMLLRSIQRVAKSEISVIVTGESGTGKELFASELHAASGRRGAFAAVNCAAIPGSLLESELFGYKRGAFSGADRDKVGIVKSADGGTLFLDEIGDMPLEAQAKLLRVLQSREIIPVGATAPERVDVRIVAATHRNLSQLQRDGKFRGDLYARLNEYTLTLPALRERKEDVFLLVRKFLEKTSRPDVEVSFPFMTGMLHYDWPFNVRELEAAMKRAVALAEGNVLGAQHLPEDIREAMRSYGVANHDSPRGEGQTLPPARYVESVDTTIGATQPALRPHAMPPSPNVRRERATPTEPELRALLAQHKGNVAAVGREFGKERMQVHRWLKRYGIDVDDYR